MEDIEIEDVELFLEELMRINDLPCISLEDFIDSFGFKV